MLDIMQLFAYYDLWIQVYLNAHFSNDFLLNILRGIMGVVRTEDGTWVSLLFYS
jgi:hypothetical protein